MRRTTTLHDLGSLKKLAEGDQGKDGDTTLTTTANHDYSKRLGDGQLSKMRYRCRKMSCPILPSSSMPSLTQCTTSPKRVNSNTTMQNSPIRNKRKGNAGSAVDPSFDDVPTAAPRESRAASSFGAPVQMLCEKELLECEVESITNALRNTSTSQSTPKGALPIEIETALPPRQKAKVSPSSSTFSLSQLGNGSQEGNGTADSAEWLMEGLSLTTSSSSQSTTSFLSTPPSSSPSSPDTVISPNASLPPPILLTNSTSLKHRHRTSASHSLLQALGTSPPSWSHVPRRRKRRGSSVRLKGDGGGGRGGGASERVTELGSSPFSGIPVINESLSLGHQELIYFSFQIFVASFFVCGTAAMLTKKTERRDEMREEQRNISERDMLVETEANPQPSP